MADGFKQIGNEVTRTDGAIPPNSNLIICLELISWKSVIDIMGDKKVLKKIMKVGEGFDRPSEGSLAKGNFSITFYNCNILPLRFTSFSCFYQISYQN